MTALADRSTKALVTELHLKFLNSELGLVMVGLPKNAAGTAYKIQSSDHVTMEHVLDPRGRSMIKACADPVIFEQKYGAGINVWMTGQALLEMMLKIESMDGVLVCSATSFHSYPIYRDLAIELLNRGDSKTKFSWWPWGR